MKNYNPGSFEVVFDVKIDAINFIRNCYDRKILARRFFIKLGRQSKEVIEDWACVGQVPKKFIHNKKNNKKNYPKKKVEEKDKVKEKQGDKQEENHEEDEKTEQRTELKK